MPTGFPSPHDDDSEDVAWGLTTGSALWKQGERYDAIVWLKRAVESASEAGLSTRADELNRAATDLIASLAVPAPAPLAAPQVAPPPPAPLAPLTSPPAPLTPPPAPRTPPPAPPAPSAPALPVEQIAPKIASAAPSPPKPPPVPVRKGPTPPKPPPPMKSRLPAPTGQSAAPPPGSAPKIPLPPPRAPMPSVTTSAPPLEELTNHPPARELPHDVPPPPTITPDIEPAPPPAPAVAIPAVAMEAQASEAHDVGVDVATDGVDEAPVYKTPVPPPVPEPEPEPEAAAEPAAAAEPPAAPDLASLLEPEPAAAATPDLASVLEPEPGPVPAAEPEGPFYLGALEASGELTDEQRKALFDSVTVQSIGADEEVIVTGLALVIDGLASVQATISDVGAGSLKAGEALYAKCSISDALSLRLVAEADPTKIAIWDLEAIESALAGSPTLLEGLTLASNRLQAIAGCTMGPLGDRLDEGLRASAIERLEVRVLQPDEVVASVGLPVPGMIIVGIGSVELENGDALGPGDFLFATEVLGGEAAPATARAGAKGAIIFFGARALAQDLLVSCPPLLEIFAGM